VGIDDSIEVPSVGERGPRVLARQILAEIIEPRVEEILTLVARELHRAGVEDLLSGGIVLTGGTASLSGIAKVADRVFQAPVRIGTPRHSGPLADIIGAPAYATGIGLLTMAGREQAGRIPMMDSAAGVLAKVKDRMSDWLREFF
jgi:cell division protein FtsA